MRSSLRLDQIEKRMRVMGKYHRITGPIVYDTENPDRFFVDGVEMTKAEVDKLIEEDESEGMNIYVPREKD